MTRSAVLDLAYLSMLKNGLNGPTPLPQRKCPFLGSLGTRCSALLPGINRRPNLCPPGTGRTRLRQAGYKVVGVWKEIASGAKLERAERQEEFSLPSPSLPANCRAGWRYPAADLLHQCQQVSDTPMVRDLAVLHAHHINRFVMNLAMSRSNSQKLTLVSPMVSL